MLHKLIEKLGSYWEPTSLTWLTSMSALVSGVLQLYNIEIPGVTEILRPIINAIHENASPGALISLGLGGIGVNGKLKRQNEALGMGDDIVPWMIEEGVTEDIT